MTERRVSDRRGLDWIPILGVLESYRREWLAQDLIAGVVMTGALIPTAMGYAEAAGLPEICGLYASVAALLVYATFGPSRILVLGPDSALAALIAATILPMSGGDPERSTALGGLLAIASGGVCLIAGMARLSVVTELLSKPIRYGYMNGIALTVLVGQLPRFLGMPTEGNDLPSRFRAILAGVIEGRINSSAVSIGAACLIFTVVSRSRAPRFPAALAAVVAATIATRWLGLPEHAGVAVIGSLPAHPPYLEIPRVTSHDLLAVAASAVAIALVSFADMSVQSRLFATRDSERIDGNRELVALGVANVVAGLFRGMCVSSSASSTAVAASIGAKTQLTAVVGAAFTASLLMAAPTLLADVPHAALAAVVIGACLQLVDFRSVLRLYRLRRDEFWLSITCFFGIVVLGVVPGIFAAVGISLAAFIVRAWRPHEAILGRVEGLKGYHDVERHPEARRIPGLVLFRWDAPLFFANAEYFRSRVLRAVAEAPTPTTWVVVAAEPVTDVDLTAADMLAELDHELRRSGIRLSFAEMKGPVKDRLRDHGLLDQIGIEYFFPTIGRAVDRYLDASGVSWKDWEERNAEVRAPSPRQFGDAPPPEERGGQR